MTLASRIGTPPPEADRTDRAGGVTTDASQFLQLRHAGRQLAVVFADDLAGTPQEVVRPGVVPKTLPVAKHLLLLRPRQRGNARKPHQEAMEIRNHRRNLCLLQHELAEQHMVRRGMPRPPAHAPRQIAMRSVVPVQQSAAKVSPAKQHARDGTRVGFRVSGVRVQVSGFRVQGGGDLSFSRCSFDSAAGGYLTR